MDSSFQPAVAPKRRLRNTTMYVNHLAKGYWIKHPSFTWHVVRFFTLKDNVDYMCTNKMLGWELKLTKTKYFVTVTVDTNEYGACKNLSCCVCYDKNNTSPHFVAHQVSENLYKIILPPRVVKPASNSVLNCCSCLRIQFKTDVKTTEMFYSNGCTRDLHRFIKFNWSHSYVSTKLPDFLLYCPGIDKINKLDSNKALLAARSVFFRDLFKEACYDVNEKEIRASPNVLCIVLYYLYTCRFIPKGLPETMEVIKLTWELDIPSLKAKCIDLISDIINEFNVHKIREEGLKRGLTFLPEKTDVFIANMGKITSQSAIKSR